MSAPRREQMLRDRWEQQLRADPAVAGMMLLVLLALATYGDRDGTRVTAGQRRLGTDTGLSERTVRRHLDTAVQLGYLAQVSRGHRRWDGQGSATVYRLALPQPVTGDRYSDDSTGQPCPVDGHSTGQRTPLNRSPAATQPVTGDRQPGSDQVNPPPPGRLYPEHAYEPNALAALTTLRADSHLTVPLHELLSLSYQAGDGDPWQGYKAVKAAALSLNGARDHGKVLRHRLGLRS